MKKSVLIVMTAFLVSSAIPVLAQDSSKQDQVICNLAARNCLGEAEAIKKRVKKLQTEMQKGKTYSPEDVQKLEQKLKEARELLDKIEGKPAKK
uniref:Uncharacterized protein n=1 Tax=Geobacter metallireducens TaxID=28232 RepID=A0A831UF66_GEOME